MRTVSRVQAAMVGLHNGSGEAGGDRRGMEKKDGQGRAWLLRGLKVSGSSRRANLVVQGVLGFGVEGLGFRRRDNLVVEGVRDGLDDCHNCDDGRSIAASHLCQFHDGALQQPHPATPNVGELRKGEFGEFDCEKWRSSR